MVIIFLPTSKQIIYSNKTSRSIKPWIKKIQIATSFFLFFVFQETTGIYKNVICEVTSTNIPHKTHFSHNPLPDFPWCNAYQYGRRASFWNYKALKWRHTVISPECSHRNVFMRRFTFCMLFLIPDEYA